MVNGGRKMDLYIIGLVGRNPCHKDMPLAAMDGGGDPRNLKRRLPLPKNHLGATATLTPRGIDACESQVHHSIQGGVATHGVPSVETASFT